MGVGGCIEDKGEAHFRKCTAFNICVDSCSSFVWLHAYVLVLSVGLGKRTAIHRSYDKAYVQGLCLNILARMQMTLCQVFPGGVPDLPSTSTLIAEMMEQPNIVELHRCLRERLQQMTACFTVMEDSGNLLYRELTAYAEKHFAEPLTLKNIAAELHYSPNYVGYVFQKKSSRSFNDYLITLRMNKVLEMMRREPDRMVYEIAESVGYNSTSSFIKQFKNVFGKTPAELRKG